MLQLTQLLKNGTMDIVDVPIPQVNENSVLVKNYFSVISSGTEGKTVSDARKGYIAKAKSRQKEVKMVLDLMKTEGLKNTYNIVMNKLEAPSPLGYSSAGRVIEVGKNIKDIKCGDFVACGGDGAFHAEVINVSRNLCVKLPDEKYIKEAAFTTLASIAMQGIRQADLRFGENCVIIGLGIIGLLTVKLLQTAGIKTIGIDINKNSVTKALEIGAEAALIRDNPGIEETIMNLTEGYGADAAIITAGSSSSDPVELSGAILRQKGKVVIVGAVPTGFSRANYYRKELELRMSTSYGPGRYDPVYEEKGIDYPIGYVRFTENRNMSHFIDLLYSKKIDMSDLITHEFNLQTAKNAYDMILSKKENFIGVVLKYDSEKNIRFGKISVTDKRRTESVIKTGFIGAGNFAQNTILPILKNKVEFIGVSSARGISSKYIAEKYKFQYCTDNSDDIINDDSINSVFIMTRHDSHCKYVLNALKKNKNVFVEKPLCMNETELKEIQETLNESSGRLMVGFNRRFSPFVERFVKEKQSSNYKAINIRVNAGKLPKTHWVNDPLVGGGRIIGEVCHFIDLAIALAGSYVKTVNANSLGYPGSVDDTLIINLEFENGSIASINYFSNGSKLLNKEKIEVFVDGSIYLIDDFKNMEIIGESKKNIKLKKQDKGHDNELAFFKKMYSNDNSYEKYLNNVLHSTLVTFKVIESLKYRKIIFL